jgi:hypothetical protein
LYDIKARIVLDLIQIALMTQGELFRDSFVIPQGIQAEREAFIQMGCDGDTERPVSTRKAYHALSPGGWVRRRFTESAIDRSKQKII